MFIEGDTFISAHEAWRHAATGYEEMMENMLCGNIPYDRGIVNICGMEIMRLLAVSQALPFSAVEGWRVRPHKEPLFNMSYVMETTVSELRGQALI